MVTRGSRGHQKDVRPSRPEARVPESDAPDLSRLSKCYSSGRLKTGWNRAVREVVGEREVAIPQKPLRATSTGPMHLHLCQRMPTD